MNLHVTSDKYGLFPKQIAMRIKRDGVAGKNRMVNLCASAVIHDEIITYISNTGQAINNFIAGINNLDKIIFHPYNSSCYNFLQKILKKFPEVQVYWAFWSSELYTLPHLPIEHYKPFSKNYVKNNKRILDKLKDNKVFGNLLINLSHASGIRKNYTKLLIDSYKHINFFCSFLPSDYAFFEKVSLSRNTKYLPFAYLSIDDTIPNPDEFKSAPGNKIMIGHSSTPYGNHYEIIQQLSNIDATYSIFLPLAYGDKYYGDLIENIARKRFSVIEVQRQKLDSVAYSKKLAEVGWAVFNTKEQQGLGNILALVFMGAKVFLDKDSSTYKDFTAWGISVFTVQNDLDLYELSNRLSEEQMHNNRKIVSAKCDPELVKRQWNAILD